MSDDIKPLNFEDFLDGIKSASVNVDIYPDTSAAEELFELLKAVSDLKDDKTVRAITDEGPQVKLERRIAELYATRITFTLRALSNKEAEIIKKRVVKDNPIAKGLPLDVKDREESERMERVYTALIAQSITKVVRHSDGAEMTGMSVEQVDGLRGRLPEDSWSQLKEGWNEAQGIGTGMISVISDPTFRRDEPISEGELVDFAAPESGVEAQDSSDTAD